MQTHTYLKSFLFENGYFQLRPVFRWYSDQEADEAEERYKEHRKSYPKMTHAEAVRHYLPETYERNIANGKLDIDEVRSRVDMEDLYMRYTGNSISKKNGKYRQVKCCMHDDRVASMSLDTEYKRYNCFTCLEKGSCFDFVMAMEGCGFREALHLLNNSY